MSENLAVCIDAVNLESALCEVDASCSNLAHGWLLLAGPGASRGRPI